MTQGDQHNHRKLLPHLIIALSLILSMPGLSIIPGIANAVSPTTNISNTSGESTDPVIAASGANVYLAWVDDTSGDNDIIFTASGDSGVTFGGQLTLDDGGGTSSTPSIASSGSNVYIAWMNFIDGNNEIYFAASDDSGSTFSDPVNLSLNPTSSNNPRIAASDSNVYIAWVDGATSTADILFMKSNDTGATFSDQITLDDDSGRSSEMRIAASGDNVYLAWKNFVSSNNEIYFAVSNSSGTSFSDPANLSSTLGASSNPAIAVSGTNVHIAWKDTTASGPGVLVASSVDSGVTFGSPPAEMNVEGLSTGIPSIAVLDSDVYVAWELLVDFDNDISDIYFAASNDSGSTFSSPADLSSNAGRSIDPIVGASADGIYVVWLDNYIDFANNEVLATFSDDVGQSFASPINLSNSPANTFKPGLAILSGSPDTAVVVMYEVPQDFSPSDVFFQSNVDFVEAVITMNPVSNAAPRWEVDTVIVTGTLSGNAGDDTITVDWGDGSLTQDILFSGGDWGPVNHTYTSDAIADNPITVVAHLLDSSNNTKASSTEEAIEIQPHVTSIDLDPISSVPPGADVTISGTLTDSDASQPIGDAQITMNGTGVESHPGGPLTTGSDGEFSITGPAPNSTADDWTVQAHFNGTQEYAASDSDLATYATVSVDAVEYQVAAGQDVVVELTNLSFNATIDFENVLQNGSIFVSECTASQSERYVAMGICADISSALLLEDGSDFTILASYEGHSIPEGFVADDVDVFHQQALSEVTDITHSRDPEASTVSGVASSFSKFIVGAAVHSEEPEGAHRQQLFVGLEPDDNSVAFRDITNTANTTAQISLDKNSYEIGETGVLTIVDPEGDVDPLDIDIVTAGIESETSRQNIPIGEASGITIVLQETAVSSGEFMGTFTLISELSSDSSLQAKNGDKLTVAYNVPGRALIAVDSVSESGLLQVSDYLVPQTADFVPFGGAIKVEPIDVQLSPGARVRVTLSYANADLEGNNPEFLKLVQEVSDGIWIDITEQDLQGNITGVDTDAKTITGETGSLGSFSIGGDVGVPGGAGGGLSRPGSGLVVDFIASVVSSSGSGGGGGGGSPSGSSSSVDVQSMIEGSDQESQFDVDNDSTVLVEFNEVTSPGSLYLKEMQISDLPSGSFLESSFSQGTVDLDGSEAETTGKIYDITYSSGFGFEPPIYVTLPYDENAMNNSSSSERDIRLLHYAGGGWEDATVSINATANTVTGKLDSLSAVVAAIVRDSSYGTAYFAEHPLSNIVSEGITVQGTAAPASTFINVTLANVQRVDQHYTVLAQTLDQDGVVMGIGWTSGTLMRAGSHDVTIDLELPDDLPAGSYSVQIMFLDDIESPAIVVLAPKSWADFDVVR